MRVRKRRFEHDFGVLPLFTAAPSTGTRYSARVPCGWSQRAVPALLLAGDADRAGTWVLPDVRCPVRRTEQVQCPDPGSMCIPIAQKHFLDLRRQVHQQSRSINRRA